MRGEVVVRKPVKTARNALQLAFTDEASECLRMQAESLHVFCLNQPALSGNLEDSLLSGYGCHVG